MSIQENTIQEHKQCITCGEVKPLECFQKNYKNKGESRKNYCASCNTKRGAQWRKDNPDRYCEMEKRRRPYKTTQERTLRKLVLEAYGGICACCGITEPEFLTVDHILNDGAAHRREVGKGKSLYYWLKRNGFPKDHFQLLCYNCNMAKGRYGICPHKAQKPVI